MGLSRTVAAIAVIPAALGFALQALVPLPVTLVLYHVAGTGLIVATAASEPFATRTPGVLGKRKDGKVRLWGKILFWPYHLGLYIRFRLRKMISNEPLYHEILPGMFVGGWPPSHCDLPDGDPSVIDCTCEFAKSHNTDRYLCLMIWDTHGNQRHSYVTSILQESYTGATMEQIKEGVEWAVVQREKDHPLYIHCAHGHGRSVALLIACMLKLGLCNSIADGEAKVKRVRPKIRLNNRQKREVLKWMEAENLTATD